MLITITILLIHATKSCLPDKILDTLIDDEEYELFQGILGELDNLDLLDDVEHAQYEADEVREPSLGPTRSATVQSTSGQPDPRPARRSAHLCQRQWRRGRKGRLPRGPRPPLT